MPELPELQAHAERLDAALRGTVLERFEALAFTALKTATPDPVLASGHAVTSVGRRGKHLLLAIGPVTFVVHLMQGGRLRIDPRNDARPRGAQARWHLADGTTLVLTEPGRERKAGVWAVAGDPLVQPPLDRLGPDADGLDVAALGEILAAAGGARLHGVLRDQRRVAGIGRLLANDLCFAAGLSPFATAGRLDADEVARLHASLHEVLDAALAHERAGDDLGPAAERRRLVHGRSGEPCPRCGGALRSVTYRSHEVVYCAACQTGGRVLKDNTTSRFLK